MDTFANNSLKGDEDLDFLWNSTSSDSTQHETSINSLLDFSGFGEKSSDSFLDFSGFGERFPELASIGLNHVDSDVSTYTTGEMAPNIISGMNITSDISLPVAPAEDPMSVENEMNTNQNSVLEESLLKLLEPKITPNKALKLMSSPCFAPEAFRKGDNMPLSIFMAYIKFIIK